MEETIQDVVRPGCKNRENLHSIISKISENASTEEPGMSDEEPGYEVTLTEHNSMKRKAERKSEGSRKLLKEDNVNESDAFDGEEPLESVQIFSDFPLDDNAPHSIGSSVQHVEGIMDPLPIYTQVPMDSPKENDESNSHLQDSDQVSDEEMNHMQQVGLVPAKKRKEEIVSIPSDVEIPFYFQRRLEELEKEVRQLHNKNRALEESYKKLSDLVEAQNHLLASGGPMLGRMPTPACTAPQTREDCVSIADMQPTDRKVIATASIPSYVTSQSVTQSSELARMQSTSPLVTKQNGVTAFELPRRVSAKEVLHLWEYGCDEFPPLKDWTPTQKLKQQSKISRWKKLVDIFQNEYGGDWNRFERSFSDNKGDVLPVTTILSLYETQQTPAFLSSTMLKENGVHSPPRIKADDEEKTTSRPRLHSNVDSEVSDISTENPEARNMEQLPKEDISFKLDNQSEVRYTLPRKVTPRDIVRLWENGCDDFPPVGVWSRAQKIGQETKIFRWKKVVDIFNSDCHRNWNTFDRKYTNEKSLPLPISAIIAKYDAEHVVHGPIFDTKVENRRNSIIAGFGSNSSFGGTENETVIVKTESMEPVEVKIELPNLGDSDDVFSLSTTDSAFGSQESLGRCTLITTEASTTEDHNGSFHFKAHRESCTSPRDDKYILPRKVTAKDVIKMWEEGYEDVPPLSTWSPSQKAGQRSKFSRWAKIYDIYKYHCKADMEEFERQFSDEKGELIPITTIVARHDARDTNASSSPSMVVQSSTEIPEFEIYQLPRKVTAKDVVKLWEEGCERFPPVSKWPKIHRVGHETKLFRWKKIVDIFRKDCGGSWEKFEERFCNPNGELLPISAILAKYDLENEPVSYFKPLNLNGSVRHSVDKPGPTMADTPHLSSNLPESTEDNTLTTDSTHPKATTPVTPTTPGTPQQAFKFTPLPTKQPEFILPKKVSALDVIYLWENGLDDMPPVCQWTSAQKASQRSKISRWNKIVDIFKYECCSDIRQFEEKYKDERGELMPITTILNLHDAQDKPWEME